jgi:outer membrane protein TolC
MSRPMFTFARIAASIAAVALATLALAAPARSAETPTLEEALADGALTLDEALGLAWDYNLDIQQAEESIRTADAQVRQAMSAYGPTIGLTASHYRVFEVPTITLPPEFGGGISLVARDTETADLTVSHFLYTAGRRRAQVRAAAAGRTSARAGDVRTRQVVAANVKRAYYGMLTAQQSVGVAQAALASAQEHLRVAQAHVEAGTAPEFDQIRAEAEVAQAQEALLRAQNVVSLAQIAVNFALGVPLDRKYELTTPLAAPAPLPDPIQTATRAMTERPELVQARAAQTAAREQQVIARSALRPNLMVAVGYEQVFQGSTFTGSTPSVSAAVSWDLYDAGLSRARAAQAQSQQRSAVLLEEQLKQTIAVQVGDAFLNLQSAADRVTATEKTVASAEEAHRIAQVRYDGGVGILLEVTDAQAALTRARNDHNLALYDYNLAAVDLALAVGEPVAPPAAP